MLARPGAAEAAAGVSSAVPAGTGLRGISIRSEVATVDLTAAFAQRGTWRSIRMQMAQVTFTATQFTGIRSVRLKVGGRYVSRIGEVPVPSPMTRGDFAGLLPATPSGRRRSAITFRDWQGSTATPTCPAATCRHGLSTDAAS